MVAIVSGATKYVVKPLAARLGVKHILYTRLEVEHGRFTGRVVEPICFEEGKIYWLQQLVEEQRIDLAKSWFYTDSVTDLPLLELVGHPVVTNPDPRLYRDRGRAATGRCASSSRRSARASPPPDPGPSSPRARRRARTPRPAEAPRLAPAPSPPGAARLVDTIAAWRPLPQRQPV